MISLSKEDLARLSEKPDEILRKAVFKIGDFGLAKKLKK